LRRVKSNHRGANCILSTTSRNVPAILHLPLILAKNLPRKGLEGRVRPFGSDAAPAVPPQAGRGGRSGAEPRKARFPALCAGNAPKLLKKTCNYSSSCGTPEAAREPVSAFADLMSEASMPHGERPGKCRNEDNVEGPKTPAASLPQAAE
jgi:hypothetical protein